MRLFILIMFFLISNVSYSQSIIQAIYGLGGFNSMGLGSIIKFPDSTFVIVGDLSNDMLILKVDSLGNQLSSKTFGDSNFTENSTVSKVVSGNKILNVGTRSQVGISSQDVLISKVDSSGILDWAVLLGDTLGDAGSDFHEQSDSSYMILGGTNRFSSNYDRGQSFIANLSQTGNVNWVKMYGIACDSCQTTLSKMLLLTDSTFLLYGSTSVFSDAFSSQKLIVKIDLNGNIIWSKLYIDNCNYSRINKIIKSQNNNIIVLGTTCGNDTDILLMEIDSAGSILWTKKYAGSPGSSDNSYDIVEVENSNYLFCGSANLTKVDSAGNVIWSASYLLSPFSNFTRNIIVNDDQYLTAGTVLFNGVNSIYLFSTDTSGHSCYYSYFNYSVGSVNITDTLVNLNVINHSFSNISNLTFQSVSVVIPDSIFCQSTVGMMDPHFSNIELDIFPNPCMENLTINVKNDKENISQGSLLEIIDVYGRKSYQKAVFDHYKTEIVNTAHLHPGLYFINLKLSNKKTIYTKFIKL